MYKTGNEVGGEFKKELAKLLKKYNATIAVGNYVQIMVFIGAKYDREGCVVSEDVELDLGEFVDEDLY